MWPAGLIQKSSYRGKAARTAAGIDLGTRTVKAVQVQRSAGGAVEVVAAVERPRRSAGPPDPAESAELAAAMTAAGFTGRSVVCAAASDQTLVGPIELPPRSSQAPLGQIARGELARNFRRAPDSFEMAWWELPSTGRSTKGVSALGVAVPHEHADARIDSIENGGLEVAAVDVESAAVLRASQVISDAPQTLAILDLAWSAATLTCVHQKSIIFSRRLPEAGVGSLHTTFCNKIGAEPEVAEFLLGEIGLAERSSIRMPARTGGAPADAMSLELPEEGRRLVLGFADLLAKELSLSFGYAASQCNDSVGLLLLVGGGARVNGIDVRLGSALGVPTRKVSPADLLPCDPRAIAACSSPTMTVALGLALRQAA